VESSREIPGSKLAEAKKKNRRGRTLNWTSAKRGTRKNALHAFANDREETAKGNGGPKGGAPGPPGTQREGVLKLPSDSGGGKKRRGNRIPRQRERKKRKHIKLGGEGLQGS